MSDELKNFTETVFDAINTEFGDFYEMDFGDDGNTIFVTEIKTNKHFTVSITEDRV